MAEYAACIALACWSTATGTCRQFLPWWWVLCLHIIAVHHEHTPPKHVMWSVVFRCKFRSYRQARRITGRKFLLSWIFLYFREKQLGFSSLPFPIWVPLAPAGSPCRASCEVAFISADLNYFVFWGSVG